MEKPTSKSTQNEINTLISSISFTESPKRCNLSFSINFDFNDVNNENSTDSENADLQIDISEVDNYEPSSKHKREAIEEASVLNKMEEEIERQLDAKAAKTNLTATNVKNILKHVISYEHLMTMIQKWLQDSVENDNFGPKLTRAKAKKLAAAKVNIPWPITTTQKTSSEVQVLIQEELPEDSSDEEYNPEHDDKQSDDDREGESTASSDVEPQSPISENNQDASSKQESSSHVQYDPEGIFKIPAIPPIPTEEESIGHRTRSKFSLSETSLQEIEQAFIPPDITADMTDDWDCDLDEDWDNFLKEFTQPLTQEPTVEDDPEADPEYNILEDEETDLLDKEELRTDKAVEVPRKEPYDLIAELLELTPLFSTQEEEQEISRKRRIDLNNITSPIENNTMDCSMADLLPALTEPELPNLAKPEPSNLMKPEQRLLLATQIQQHVQLMAQHFAMTYMHPEYHSLAKICKQNLNSLRHLSNGPNSMFNAQNLEEALKLVSTWENMFSDAEFCVNFNKNMAMEIHHNMHRINKARYPERFPPELEKLFIESKALMYPQLLPEMAFRSGFKNHSKHSAYSKAEEILVALGIEQFLPFVASKPKKFKMKRMQLCDTAQLINQYLLPCRDTKGILAHIDKRRYDKDGNPIRYYFKKGCAPTIVHCISLENMPKAPKDQPIELLPPRWHTYLSNQKYYKSNLMKSEYILDSNGNFDKQGININAIMKLKYPSVSSNHPLRNPVINMLPKILPATVNPKATSTTDKTDTSAKRNSKLNDDDSNDKNVFDNNIQTAETHVEINKMHTNLRSSSKRNITDAKTMQITADKADTSAKRNSKLNDSDSNDKNVFDNNIQTIEAHVEMNKIRTNLRSSSKRNTADAKAMQTVVDKADTSAKRNSKLNGNDSNDKNVLDNNIQTTEAHVETNKIRRNLRSYSKRNTADAKAMQTDKLPDINNTIVTRSVKSEKSSQISAGLPQIRKTTPRLAKTRSAQNMKLMALGSKSLSTSSTLKSKEKDNTDKNVDEHSTASKVDNEEEIAELMLASTTIIKDPVSRKKAKQTRELEIIKRLLKAENLLTEEEREAKFAASYLQKLHLTLESKNPETFRAVIKLYLDYSEKLENINQTVVDTPVSEEFPAETLQDNATKKDILTIQLYQDVCKTLQNYPEICTDFLLFLKPHQVAMIGKSIEYMTLQKMKDFVHIAQIYFAKQPSRIAKMMQAITQLSSDPHTTLENVHAVMSPVFKGHPLVMDLFLQVLPTAKPPESLFAPHMFENLTCPLGPYDKNVIYTENAPELYENIELPTIANQDDPYGGENCKCDCHGTDDLNLKNNSEHCVSCGTRFFNGRIYLQTPEGLRPAKVTFPGEDQERLENIARISLKVADKVIPPIPSKKRRKSAKNEPNHEDICQKQCATKDSPLKDNEDNEKAISKSKKNVKFALKVDQRKVLKRKNTVDDAIANKKMRISQCKNKREKKTEETDASLEHNELDIIKQEKINEFTETETKSCMQSMQDNASSTEIITQITPSTSNSTDRSSNSRSIETTVTTTAIENNIQSKIHLIDKKSWTRQEDMFLLQSIKKEYSENTFLLISEKLENRTVEQVKERCQTLLSLLEKMI